MRHRPAPPLEPGFSPRSQKITPYNSKKSVPSIPHYSNVLNDQAADNSDLLIISPIPLNRKYKQSPRAAPPIVRPKVDSSRPSYNKNQKSGKDNNSERIPKRDSFRDLKEHTLNQKYSADIQEIENLLNQLIAKHPDNEEYYRKHYSSFLRILNEAANTNPAKVPVIFRNTKMFFEGLLNGQIGRRGKITIPNFDFEQKLRTIITKPSNTNKSYTNHSYNSNSNSNNINDDDDENVFKELFEENASSNRNGSRNSSRSGRFSTSNRFSCRGDDIDLSNLKMYEAEIEEIRNLMHKLINKHPENEDYYRKHYETFLRVLSEAVNTNRAKAPIVIHNTKLFFEGLLNGQIGKNGKFERTNFDFEQKLKSILSSPDDDKSNKNVFQDIFDEQNLSNLKMYENEIKEIQNLMNKLISKYPENEDYYRNLYDTFLRVLNDAVRNNSSRAPEIINNTRLLFEGLLNDKIGSNGRIDDDDFNFEQRLRSILSKKNNDKNDENVFKDLFDKKNLSNLKKYESDIKGIQKLVDQLIKKHPENEEYYRKLFDDFMKVLNEAVQNNNPRTQEIIDNARTFFEGLLNDQIGTNGRIENDNFNFEDRLRSILNKDEGDHANENVFQDLFDEHNLSNLKKYESEIQEIQNLVDQLVDKHPENEEYYRNLYDDFMKVLNEAVQNNNPRTQEIIDNARTFFEGLLNDQIGTNGRIEDDNFNFEDRLRSILSEPKNDNSNENENVFQDLFDENSNSNLKKYESELKEIEDLVNQLISKHPENEDYYRREHESFNKVLNEASKTNSDKIPTIIQNGKLFFESLLNDKIGTNGKIDDDKFNFEERLESLLSNDNKDNNDENIFKDLFDENNNENLKKYESDIKGIQKLVDQLVEKHPENEEYYRNLYDDFMKVLNEAVQNNNPRTQEIIDNARTFFEGLLNDQIGTNGRIEDDNFNFKERLESILNKNENDNSNENENVFQDLFDENSNSNLKKYESELKEIEDLVNQLISKHPENEDYYRREHESFNKVLNEASKTNSDKIPTIIQNGKLFFESLLNDKIGTNGKIDDDKFNFEERLESLLSNDNNDNNDESIFKDFSMTSSGRYNIPALAEDPNATDDDDGQSGAKSEIGEIEELLNKLIEKYPENEDFYRKLYDAFVGVIKEAEAANSPQVPKIALATKRFFEELLNGDHAKIDFNIEDKLREILGKAFGEQEEEQNQNKNQNQNENEENKSHAKSVIGEIEELLNKLIEKYPENEDFYRKLYDAFVGVIKEAAEANSPQVPQIALATKRFFEELLNGDHAKIDFTVEDKLREILGKAFGNGSNNDENSQEDDDQSGLNKYKQEIGKVENLVQKLIDKHPENEDYYRKLFDAFMKVIREAVEENNPAATEVCNVAKIIFEELLNGDQDKLDFDMEEKLRKILSESNENQNENENNGDQSGINKYKQQIGEVENILQQLVDKNPENEDYYRKLFDAFMKVIREAAEENNPAAAEVCNVAKHIFEDLLNGDKDKLDFDMEDRLRKVLSESNENENDDDQSGINKYKQEIGEMENLLQQLVDKNPENEDYYRKLFDAFMKVIREAAEENNPAAIGVFNVAKHIFEDLLNGDKDKLDFDMEERLRKVLSDEESIYKPYDQIDDVDGMTDEEILREAEKISTTRNPRFAHFSKLYPPPKTTPINKKSGVVPNYQTIINALRFTSLPGPKYTDLVESLINSMKESKEERFVLLMASRTQKFKGIYILAEDGSSATKMWGQGPNVVKNEDCCAYYKYLNGQKQFDILEVRGFTQTTDGFSMKKNLEPNTW